jgi:hypothetical protein
MGVRLHDPALLMLHDRELRGLDALTQDLDVLTVSLEQADEFLAVRDMQEADLRALRAQGDGVALVLPLEQEQAPQRGEDEKDFEHLANS